MAKNSKGAKPITTAMKGISSTTPSKSAVEKKYPVKSLNKYGSVDTYKPRPPKH